MNPLNNELGRYWLAMTLNMLFNRAQETQLPYWIRVRNGEVLVGEGPRDDADCVVVAPGMEPAQLMVLAANLGALAAAELQTSEFEFKTYPKGIVPLNLEEQVLVRCGRKIAAIKELRMRVSAGLKKSGWTGNDVVPVYGLKDAKDSVDAYVPPSLFSVKSDIPNDPEIIKILQKHGIVLPETKPAAHFFPQ